MLEDLHISEHAYNNILFLVSEYRNAPMLRLPVNSYRCCYANCSETMGLKTVQKKNRIEILRKYKLFISKRACICIEHMNIDWSTCRRDAIDNFSEAQLKEVMDILSCQIKESINPSSTDFDLAEFDIGISHSNFEELFDYLHHLRRELKSQKKCKLALAMYLMRLRTGDSLKRLRKTFNVSYETEKKYLNVARRSILLDFIPSYLGFANLTREILLENSSKMARELHNKEGNHVILVADASYIFYQKSGNHEIQRLTYSDQKKRNFVKPMVITTTNGLYVDIFGPYKANQNDAVIIQDVFERYGPFELIQSGDVFLLDRGFRDSSNFLKSKGFNIKMPEFITKKDKTSQLTTEKANHSRMVTSCRFSIETRNGNIKQIWQIFNKTWISYEMHNLMDDYKIGAALINKFFKRIESNIEDAEEISTRMKQQLLLPNEFARIVNGSTFQSKVKIFTEENADIVLFPLLQSNEIKQLTLGNYQIKQGLSYIVEHVKKNNGKFLIYKCPKDIILKYFKDLVSSQKNRIHLQVYLTYMYSRFSQNSKHVVYVIVDSSLNGRNGIIGHVCDCRHGLRVVGCCSHIAALVSYLGYYRHNKSKIKPVASFMNNFFLN